LKHSLIQHSSFEQCAGRTASGGSTPMLRHMTSAALIVFIFFVFQNK
jgi:hypothetical protein